MLGFLTSAPHRASAQPGGSSAQTTARTQFVFQDGVVVRRDGTTITPLTQNVRLKDGTKINYKSGIIELPTGKITTLREGDFVRPDGGIVFGSPASAAAARGETVKGGEQFDTYVQKFGTAMGPAQQLNLMQQKIELLEQKVTMLSEGRSDAPSTSLIDKQIEIINNQLQPATK